MSAPSRASVLFRRILKGAHEIRVASYTILPPTTLYPVRKEINRYKNELPGDHKTWKQVQAELKENDDAPEANIGVKWRGLQIDRREMRRQIIKNRQNKKLEQEARLNTFEVPIDEVLADSEEEYGPELAMKMIKHYGIYKDLFNGAYFTPVVQLRVNYDLDEEYVTPVFRGNKISPAEARTAPAVSFEAEEDSLWTLLMTNPDGHLTDNNSEYLHWLIGNIKGGDISTGEVLRDYLQSFPPKATGGNIKGGDIASGEVLCDYLQPFPTKGTGFHRHVFVLFKQEKELDFSQEKRPQNCTSLKERTFQTAEFYRKLSDDLTPMGLCFYQSEWDDTVKDTYHHTLNMRAPGFEYAHPPHYRAVQTRYPKREPFDRYFDRYRDKKEINEEVLRLKLDMISPFEPYEQKSKYPLIHYKHRDIYGKPTWLVRKEQLMHRRLEQFEDLPIAKESRKMN